MSVQSAVAGTATAGVLVGVLGSPAVVNAAQDLAERHRSPVTAATLTGFPSWDVFGDGTPANVVWGVVLELGVLLILAAVLTGMAGRASRPAAFLAGWGSLVVAAGIAGAAHFAYEDAVLGAGRNPFGVSYVDNLLGAANTGAAFGLWTGWLVGAAVAATVRVPERVALPEGVATGPIARSPGRRPPITPPAPWWAADASPLSPVAYNAPSVFPMDAAQQSTVADAETAAAPRAPDLDSTLATPLARVGEDRDATRPIPGIPPIDAPDVDDPTIAEPATVEHVADPTAVDPG